MAKGTMKLAIIGNRNDRDRLHIAGESQAIDIGLIHILCHQMICLACGRDRRGGVHVRTRNFLVSAVGDNFIQRRASVCGSPVEVNLERVDASTIAGRGVEQVVEGVVPDDDLLVGYQKRDCLR